jgi:catechol 2,3-dioxygenase-like lactoylglutathione lyase family enzyme
MAPTLTAIDHVHVFVSDRAAAESWYARVLGLERVPSLAFWAVDGGPLTIANAANDIHLALFEKPREKCRSTVALGTSAPGFVAWQGHLRAALGHEPRAVDHAVSWSLYFEDPDGNPYEITCDDHAAVSAVLGKHDPTN